MGGDGAPDQGPRARSNHRADGRGDPARRSGRGVQAWTGARPGTAGALTDRAAGTPAEGRDTAEDRRPAVDPRHAADQSYRPEWFTSEGSGEAPTSPPAPPPIEPPVPPKVPPPAEPERPTDAGATPAPVGCGRGGSRPSSAASWCTGSAGFLARAGATRTGRHAAAAQPTAPVRRAPRPARPSRPAPASRRLHFPAPARGTRRRRRAVPPPAPILPAHSPIRGTLT